MLMFEEEYISHGMGRVRITIKNKKGYLPQPYRISVE